MLVSFRSWSLVVLAGAALAGSVHAQAPLRWKLTAGQVLHHTVTQDANTSVDVGGQKIETKMKMSLQTVWTVNRVDSAGTADISQTYANIQFKVTGPLGINIDVDTATPEAAPNNPLSRQLADSLTPLKQARILFKLSSLGEISEVTIPAESQAALQKLQGGQQLGSTFSQEGMVALIRDSVILLPAQAPSPGSKWQFANELKTPPVGTMKNETTLEYVGRKDVAGKQLDEISLAVRSQITPDAGSPLAKLTIKEQSEKGKVFFDNQAGRLSHSESEQSLVMEVTAQGRTYQQSVKTIKKARTELAK